MPKHEQSFVLTHDNFKEMCRRYIKDFGNPSGIIVNDFWPTFDEIRIRCWGDKRYPEVREGNSTPQTTVIHLQDEQEEVSDALEHLEELEEGDYILFDFGFAYPICMDVLRGVGKIHIYTNYVKGYSIYEIPIPSDMSFAIHTAREDADKLPFGEVFVREGSLIYDLNLEDPSDDCEIL